MCIIAIKKASVPMFSDQLIRNMYDRNPDGAGIMYRKGNDVHIEKGFFSADKVLEYCHAHAADLADTDVVMHFRIATSGKKDGLGCHPYPVWNKNSKTSCDVKLAMVHNGILDTYGYKGTDEINDTQVFIKELLRKLPHNFLRNQAIMSMIGKTIGTNKLAFLDKDGVTTVGEFIEDDGYLYSNTSYKGSTFFGRTAETTKKKEWWSDMKPLFPYSPDLKSSKADNLEKERKLEELEKGGTVFFKKLSAGKLKKLKEWLIKYTEYQTSVGEKTYFTDDNFRYVVSENQEKVSKYERIPSLKTLSRILDSKFVDTQGKCYDSIELPKPEYMELRDMCEKYMRPASLWSYYNDDYIYEFDDDGKTEFTIYRTPLFDTENDVLSCDDLPW